MSEQTHSWSASTVLASQAVTAWSNGDKETALNLIEQAMNLAEQGGDPIASLEEQRNAFLATVPPNVPELILALQRHLVERAQLGDLVEQIDTLLNLATLVSDNGEAMRYLDEAEALLTILTPDKIEQIKRNASLKSPVGLPQRAKVIRRLKRSKGGKEKN